MQPIPTNLALLTLALTAALLLRPWRLMVRATRLTPILAALTLLPWLWAMPSLQKMPLQLQGSGACLVLLMLGWPLAVPVLCVVGVLAALISPMSWETALDLTVWLGLVAHWLAAWGDAFMTGLFVSIMVAFKPQWLATWSDRLYLKH